MNVDTVDEIKVFYDGKEIGNRDSLTMISEFIYYGGIKCMNTKGTRVQSDSNGKLTRTDPHEETTIPPQNNLPPEDQAEVSPLPRKGEG